MIGCATTGPADRLNSPPQGDSNRPNALAPQFTFMADNAMLHDMSIADIHFVPHTSELSGTGVARLTRMAKLLEIYGGTVRYETFEKDEALVEARLDHAREFIAGTGCDMDRVKVETMISGGRGLKATEAIRIMEEGTVNDALNTESGGASSPEGAASSSGVGG